MQSIARLVLFVNHNLLRILVLRARHLDLVLEITFKILQKLILVKNVGKPRHLAPHIVKADITLRNIILALLALPLFNLLLVVAAVRAFFEKRSILILLLACRRQPHLLEQFVILRVHVRNPPYQRQSRRNIFDLFIMI